MMSPQIALHDPVFRVYLLIVPVSLVLGGAILGFLHWGLRKDLGSIWKTYRSWLVMASIGLLVVFAGIAIILAAAGLYGVVSWGVSQRVNEIAIRMALGATPGEVHRMVLLKGLRPTFLGIAIGIPMAISASGLLRGLLFEVGAVDPFTFTIVPLMLLAVAVLACSVPAIRATRIDPTIGLRAE